MTNFNVQQMGFLKRGLLLSAISLVLLLSACTQDDQVSSEQGPVIVHTLLENLRVIVGDGSVIENASILIAGDTIAAVIRGDVDALPAGTERIDMSGKTVMPALIDTHAHLGYDAASSWGADNYGLENLQDNLNRYAYYGFSAVFSAGSDPDDLALELQQLQATGQVGGARFLFAAGMAPPGQGPNNQFLVHALAVEQETGMTILRGLESPQQARSAVEEVANKGIQFIKIWVDDRSGTQDKLRPEIYRAVMSAASEFNIDVFVHQQAASDMLDLIAAGTKGFLHGRIENGFTTEISVAAKQANVFIVPNLGLAELRREAIGNDPFLSQVLPVEVVQRLGESAQRQIAPVSDQAMEQTLKASMAMILAAGVDIALGTDAGAVPDHPFGYTGHRELEIYVRLGMTPLQAISAGTIVAARVLGLENSGQIRQGYLANLLILESNPAQDIRNTRDIFRVYLSGTAIDRAELARTFSQN